MVLSNTVMGHLMREVGVADLRHRADRPDIRRPARFEPSTRSDIEAVQAAKEKRLRKQGKRLEHD